MDKRYKSRKINNLHDLHLEQVRVRNAYRNMELNWIQAILSPEAILTTAVHSILSPSSKKGNLTGTRTNYFRRLFQKNKKQREQQAIIKAAVKEQAEIISEEKARITKKSYKKLGRNLLIWQSASLLAFIGINLFIYFRKKKKAKQATYQP